MRKMTDVNLKKSLTWQHQPPKWDSTQFSNLTKIGQESESFSLCLTISIMLVSLACFYHI